jgi:hypothetical protein
MADRFAFYLTTTLARDQLESLEWRKAVKCEIRVPGTIPFESRDAVWQFVGRLVQNHTVLLIDSFR